MAENGDIQVTTSSESIAFMHERARSGDTMFQILVSLLSIYVKPRWEGHLPYIDLERLLVNGLYVPLESVREIERWTHLNHDGDIRDAELNDLFEPWLAQYRNGHTHLH